MPGHDRGWTASMPLVMHPAVILNPVDAFPEAVRSRLAGSGDDVIVSRRRARMGSQRISAETAAFLRLFEQPSTIIEATIAHAERYALDPAALLDDAYPLILRFRQQRILVQPGDADGADLEARFVPGERIFGLRIERCVHALSDTEIYRAVDAAGQSVALKYVLAGAPEYVRAALRNESAVLRAGTRAGGILARLLSADLDRVDPYIVMDWFDGETLDAVLRTGGLPQSRRAQTAKSLLQAYRTIHQAGVLHGDVHPGNILVERDSRVHLVDFGGALAAGVPATGRRLGLVAHYEPEVASAVQRGVAAPLPSDVGEQYAVAALVFMVLTGSAPLRLALETAQSLEQIVRDRPRSFRELGTETSAVELVLGRALAKRPNQRYRSFETFATSALSALAEDMRGDRAIATNPPSARRRSRASLPDPARVSAKLHRTYGLTSGIARYGLPEGPSASIYHGAAGISLAFLRLAVLGADPEALAASNVWLGLARQSAATSKGFAGPKIGLHSSDVGPASVFHARSGLRLVGTLVHHALADETATRADFDAYLDEVTASKGPWSSPVFGDDAANGSAGRLLGLAMLAPVAQSLGTGAMERWAAAGLDCAGEVERLLSGNPDGPGSTNYLGYAHGTAGRVHALLRWSQASGAAMSAPGVAALTELGRLAEVSGNRAWWPLGRNGPREPWSGWCHGSAGYVLLWSLAAEVLGPGANDELAMAAAQDVWAARELSGSSLCCGLAGQAIILTHFGVRTGLSIWIERGRSLAGDALRRRSHPGPSRGLFKGDAGLLLAALETQSSSPQFPLCETAG
jgi:serine/threonine-protein kinase